MTNNCRYYRIAEITIQVESDLPITESTFCDTLELFRVDGPGADTVTIHHHFELPDLITLDLSTEVYRKAPWAIYRQYDGWLYLGIAPQADDKMLHRVVLFNHDHTHAQIYNPRSEIFQNGNVHSLTMFPSDQILIARLLANRQGCYLHSAGAILDGSGMLFVGHSDAGKSTTTRLLMEAGDPGIAREAIANHARGKQSPHRKSEITSPQEPLPAITVEILCDDRNIVRRRENGWRVYGTWSHGDVPEVSPSSAPLSAICFIEQANENTLTPLTNRKEITRRLLACVIKPFVTADWWHKTLDLIEKMVGEVPCYVMRFDKSGAIVEELKKQISANNSLIQI
jgi:hypothetical protein